MDSLNQIMLGFGVLGYFFKKLDYPVAPMVLAMVLGDRAEEAFRQSLLGSSGSLMVFVSNPLVASITGLAMLMLLSPAKTLDYDTPVPRTLERRATEPLFLPQAATLIDSVGLTPWRDQPAARLEAGRPLACPSAACAIGRKEPLPTNDHPTASVHDRALWHSWMLAEAHVHCQAAGKARGGRRGLPPAWSGTRQSRRRRRSLPRGGARAGPP